MLPRSFERLVEGSLFWWDVTCHCHSALDVDTLMVMLGAFLTNCRIGGKKATGHGRLNCLKAWDMHVPRPAEQATEVDATALGTGVGSIFRKHVADRKEQVKTWLESVNA
jgi:CRISPR/Cas system CSM-associated protein Csm3 (group 7 of RAMP superfamily)